MEEHYLLIQEKKLFATWMNIKDIMVNKRSYCMILLEKANNDQIRSARQIGGCLELGINENTLQMGTRGTFRSELQ